jgi:ABC-type lipoprotein release transport system permease subunit
VIVPALERLLSASFLPKDIYLISRMPSDPQRATSCRWRDLAGAGLRGHDLPELARQPREPRRGAALLTLIAPAGQVTPAGVVPRLKQMTVAGTFDSGHYEYDSALVLLHHEDAQRIFRLEGPTGIRLKLKDLHQAREVTMQLAGSLSDQLLIRDWTQQNRTWFAAVQLEKRMMFIILTLIVAVAAFNLVSTLVMTVTDKRADIAILRTLGASPKSIMGIFVVQGAMVGVIGTCPACCWAWPLPATSM